jgi:carbonic anhydrase
MTAKHTCQAIVVSCMDFRLGKYLHEWCGENIKGGYDRLSIAGAAKDTECVVKHIEISTRLHGTKEVYLINHEDCGAYGASGTYEKHKEDLTAAKKIIAEKYPDLTIYLLYLKLNGTVEWVY